MWSNWPDEPAKKGWVTNRVREFEAANKQCSVKLSFIPKADMCASEVRCAEPGRRRTSSTWSPTSRNFSPAAFWSRSTITSTSASSKVGRRRRGPRKAIHGVPVEAYTVELYYNKDLLKKVGIEVPPSAQLTQAQFSDLVKKSVAAGITPVSQGVGDRPYPGAFLLYKSLLRKLGTKDYGSFSMGHCRTRILASSR